MFKNIQGNMTMATKYSTYLLAVLMTVACKPKAHVEESVTKKESVHISKTEFEAVDAEGYAEVSHILYDAEKVEYIDLSSESPSFKSDVAELGLTSLVDFDQKDLTYRFFYKLSEESSSVGLSLVEGQTVVNRWRTQLGYDADATESAAETPPKKPVARDVGVRGGETEEGEYIPLKGPPSAHAKKKPVTRSRVVPQRPSGSELAEAGDIDFDDRFKPRHQQRVMSATTGVHMRYDPEVKRIAAMGVYTKDEAAMMVYLRRNPGLWDR